MLIGNQNRGCHLFLTLRQDLLQLFLTLGRGSNRGIADDLRINLQVENETDQCRGRPVFLNSVRTAGLSLQSHYPNSLRAGPCCE